MGAGVLLSWGRKWETPCKLRSPPSSAHLQVTPSEGWEKVKVESLSPVHLWDPMDCSPPGSSVHGITQVRILEWAALHFSRGSS